MLHTMASAGLSQWEVGLVVSGLLLQIIGAALSFIGINITWKAIANENERFTHLVLEQVRTLGMAVVDAALRFAGRPRTQTLQVHGVDAGTGMEGAPRVVIALPPIPPDAMTEEKLEALQSQISTLLERVNHLQAVQATEQVTREAAIRDLRNELGSEIKRREEQDRSREVEALKREISGFWLITVGFIVGGVGSGSAPSPKSESAS
jgi:hypothetical protein